MLVSIVIPVYNTSLFLNKCIDSVINQTYQNLEIIIINDGSTDDSLKIIDCYDDPRIKVIDKKNGGISSARNTGIAYSHGEYIAQIDSDDYVELDFIEKMLELAIRENLDIVVSDYYSENSIENKTYLVDLPIESSKIITSDEYLDSLFDENKSLPMVWNKLIRRELFCKHLIRYPENVSLGEDLFVIPVLAHYSRRIGKINSAFYHYINNPNSVTRTSMCDKIYQIQFVFEYLQIFFKERDLRSYYLVHMNPRMRELTNSDLFSQQYKREIWNYLYVFQNKKYILGSYTLFLLYRMLINSTRAFRRMFL